MLDLFITPWQFAAFVAAALALLAPSLVARPRLRMAALLAFNVTLLGVWIGSAKGLAFHVAWATLAGLLIRRLGPGRRLSAGWCAAAVAIFVGALLAAKYALPHNPKAALGVRHAWATISLSFLTFRLVHLALDTHAGLVSRPGWLPFLNYVFFVPVSAAGPIQRFQEFEPQLREPQAMDGGVFLSAIRRIILGIAKKVLVATFLSPYVLGNMEPFGRHPFLVLAAACALYSVYLYVDFSGYTDIAIGSARLFGIRLPENFNKPWLAVDLQDFWTRWHMTLSIWLRVYLFFPMMKWLVGRFPGGARRTDPALAVIITFAIAGAWHGDAWGFLIFGLLHGLGMAAVFLARGRPIRAEALSPAARLLARVATFAYVSACWIPFVYPVAEIPWLLSLTLR
jgi:alginate O-acetyltransferase complex protein AlgI